MQEIQNITGNSLVGFLFNLVVMLASGYIVILVNSIRKEFKLKIENNKELSDQRFNAIEENYKAMKICIDDLLVRCRVLGVLEERLQAGSENFHEIKDRLCKIEIKTFGKGQ